MAWRWVENSVNHNHSDFKEKQNNNHDNDIFLSCNVLTHLPQVLHICVSESGQHWSRWWFVAYSAPSLYLNQYRVIVNWTLRNNLQRNFNQNTKLSFTKMHLKISSAKLQPFCSEEVSVWRGPPLYERWNPPANVVSYTLTLFERTLLSVVIPSRNLSLSMEANTGHRVQSTRRWAAISLPENWPFLSTIYNNLFVNVWIYFNIQLLQNTGIRNKSLLQGHHLFHMETLLQWRHIGCDGVSSHQPHHCLLNCLFRRRSKKTSKLCVTVLCAGNSPETGEFPAQMASNAEKVSVWWRHHMVAKICSDELGLHWFKWWLVVCWASSNYLNLWTLQWRHNEHQGVSNHRCLEFAQQFAQAQIKENIKAPRHWPL